VTVTYATHVTRELLDDPNGMKMFAHELREHLLGGFVVVVSLLPPKAPDQPKACCPCGDRDCDWMPEAPDPQSHTTCEEVVGLLPKCVIVDCERPGQPLMCAEHRLSDKPTDNPIA
jgi:hypothetical protein